MTSTDPPFPFGDAFERAGTGDHEVRANECMSSIAEANGFFWETLWDHPDNAELAHARKDPNLLAEGDRVAIPPRREKTASCAVDQRHRFRRRGVPEVLRLRFLDPLGEPRANLPYRLEIAGKVQDGQLDGEGYLEVWIAPRVCRARLALVDPETSRTLETFDLEIGRLPPIDSGEGIAARLANLGLYTAGTELTVALAGFQRQFDLEETGVFDGPTRAKLLELNGC